MAHLHGLRSTLHLRAREHSSPRIREVKTHRTWGTETKLGGGGGGGLTKEGGKLVPVFHLQILAGVLDRVGNFTVP